MILFDLNPKTWLSQYCNKSIYHISILGLFYHILGIALMTLGNMAASSLVPEYMPTGMPISIVSSLASGPIEESIFFGIPYLIFSNHHPWVLLMIGSMWSLLHLFNASTFDLANISYGAFLFTIPHIFFSIRTWTSGKGWIAIVFHSIWNLTILLYVCSMGLIQCLAFGQGEFFIKDILLMLISITVSILIYFSYQIKQNKTFPKIYYIVSLAILIISAVPLAILNLISLF